MTSFALNKNGSCGWAGADGERAWIARFGSWQRGAHSILGEPRGVWGTGFLEA